MSPTEPARDPQQREAPEFVRLILERQQQRVLCRLPRTIKKFLFDVDSYPHFDSKSARRLASRYRRFSHGSGEAA